MPANYVLLERVTTTSTVASVVIDNIPQTGYTDLKIVVSARNDRGSTGPGYLRIQFNGVSTGYTRQALFTSTDDGNPAAQTGSDNYISFGVNTAASTANTFCNGEIYIPNYTSSNLKPVTADFVSESNTAFNTAVRAMTSLLSTNTAAINSVTLLGDNNFLAGSEFSLYGLAKFGVEPVAAPKASGGDIVESDGTYWYHTFLGSGVFTPNQTLSCDVLVVAGGGGGGGGLGGGGGAGGFRTATGLSVASSTNYAVTVGAGGAGGGTPTSALNVGRTGSNSIFATITSSGGGGGAGADPSQNATTGGSGGGGTYNKTTGAAGNAGSYSPVEGFAGGTGFAAAPNYGGGGGGGASAVGGTYVVGVGAGVGGAGTASSISGSSVTYAGGGGGCFQFGTGSGGAGGAGGGGTGGNSNSSGTETTAPTSGTANRGGGGGGGYTAGSGGSGIVIVRYAV